MSLIGVDIGGTKIAVGVVDGDKLVSKQVEPTSKEGWHAVLNQVASMVQQIRHLAPDAQHIGIGVPGPIDYKKGEVKFAPNIYDFNNVPVVHYLSERLGMGVVLENDANAAALGEAVLGAGKGTTSAIFITVSTGIGGGIVINGKVLRGSNGIAGEIGHMIVTEGGSISGAGQAGALEAIASGTAISRDASYALNKPTGTPEVFKLAKEGHPVAQALVHNAMRQLGRAISNLQKVFDPEVVIIGGGVAEVGEYFFKNVQIYADEGAQGFAPVYIRKAQLGTDAGLIGAALSSASSI